MPKLSYHGPIRYRIASFLKLNQIAASTAIRHAMGRRIAPDWDVMTEIGIRFWRHQFTKAMNCTDIVSGRKRFNSLLTMTDDTYDVTTEECDAPFGLWVRPNVQSTKRQLLYFHGGGYSFRGPVSIRFAEMLAHHTGADLFMPFYRLTPEHPHPAQSDDGFAAWSFMTKDNDPKEIAVIGDSAGGHMALMLLQRLKAMAIDQPAICIGLCPWTDIGPRGASMTGNNKYDLVQGWMAEMFGRWLDPQGAFGRRALSPICHDFSGLAPLYLQAGGREILRDMIVEFADRQRALGATVMLDIWADMPHDFQSYDSSKTSSAEALSRIAQIVQQPLLHPKTSLAPTSDSQMSNSS